MTDAQPSSDPPLPPTPPAYTPYLPPPGFYAYHEHHPPQLPKKPYTPMPDSLLLQQPASVAPPPPHATTPPFDHLAATSLGLAIAAVGLAASQSAPFAILLALAALVVGTVALVRRKRFTIMAVLGIALGFAAMPTAAFSFG